ncbi:MAG: hypothetical protein M0Z50_04725 [Planctomycetia bacterium]|nr:hypothetical protein [Planctomycetia bacterium]
MAVDTAKITRRRLIAAVIETTTGTPEALAAVNAAMIVMNPKTKSEIPTQQRPGMTSFSPFVPIAGARKGQMTFSTELAGSGTAGTVPFWAGVLLPGIGFPVPAAGDAFVPATGNGTTLTLGHYVDGRLAVISGAMGSCKITAEFGKPVTCDWTFDGLWQGKTDTALLTPTWPTVVPPRFAGAALTVGGNAYNISKCIVDIKNTVSPRQDVTNATGYHSFFIVDREITVAIDPEAVPIAAQDWYTAHLDSTTFAFSLQIGSVAGNMVTLAAPKLALVNAPEEGDRAGIVTDDLTFAATTSGGNDDEFSITFG